MKKILILGGTGGLGKVLVKFFLNKNYEVVVLVRSPDKLRIKNKKLEVIKGSVVDKNDLEKALEGVDAVVSVLGHGFRTKYPILEISLKNLIPQMKKRKINRFITVTGAALKYKKDPDSIVLEFSNKVFNLIDPYRMNDAKAQKKILEESELSWTIIRTPIHRNGDLKDIKNVGYIQPKLWNKISRITIAQFILECIENNKYIRKAPIIF